jgi:DNA-binding response OmpR family regulator
MSIASRFGSPPEEWLLVAEADSQIGEGLRDFFRMKDYPVTLVQDGVEAFRELTRPNAPYDAAILGVRLPERGGFAVLREARRQGVETPVIVLTTLAKSVHKIRAFQLGADDCLTKPFDINELAARVRAVRRRGRQHADSRQADRTYSFGELTVDLQERTVTEGGAPLGLTDTEFSILECLLRNQGRPVPREQLLREVWALKGEEVNTRRLSRHIASLRKKIEPTPEDPTHLQTVFGVGYKITG